METGKTERATKMFTDKGYTVHQLGIVSEDGKSTVFGWMEKDGFSYCIDADSGNGFQASICRFNKKTNQSHMLHHEYAEDREDGFTTLYLDVCKAISNKAVI